MAHRARVTNGAPMRLLVVSAVVLVVHFLALQWLATQLGSQSVLRPMAAPMFTRVLRPQAPNVPVMPTKAATAARRPRHPAMTSLGRAPAPATRAASADGQTAVRSDEALALEHKPPSDSETEAASLSQAPTASAQAPAASSRAPDIVTEQPRANSIPDATLVIAAPASAASPAGALDSWPADTRLNYRLGGLLREGQLHGDARVQWQRQGGFYESRVDIDLTLLASLVLTSQGEVTPQGLLPKAYEELRRGGRRSVRLEDNSVVLTDGRRISRPAGVQDTASQFVELSHRFATGQDRLEVGQAVSLWMARPGGVDLWTYDVVERQMLQLPGLGAVEAFHLKPRAILNPRGNITAEMWFAPSLQYLPVRIRVSMGDEAYVELTVEKIEQR